MDVGNCILGILLVVASLWMAIVAFYHWKDNNGG